MNNKEKFSPDWLTISLYAGILIFWIIVILYLTDIDLEWLALLLGLALIILWSWHCHTVNKMKSDNNALKNSLDETATAYHKIILSYSKQIIEHRKLNDELEKLTAELSDEIENGKLLKLANESIKLENQGGEI